MNESRANDESPLDPSDADERVGEAVEAYLALAEQGPAPEIDAFAGRYPEMKDDVRAAIEGLELVHGLLGLGSAHGSGSGRGSGVDHRIESGRRIAGYRVVRELGRGGMGTVYEAVHVGLDRPVALKVLGIHAAPDSSARRRFLNEARTAAGLHHTHIVPVFDVGQVGGLCYYAMQRIEGSGLDSLVRHLRRSRPSVDGGGGGPAGSRFLPMDGQSSVGTSSINSRLGNLWIRVASGWLRRPQQRVQPPSARGASRTRHANEAHPRGGLGDSTASWQAGSRHGRLLIAGAEDEVALSAILSASHSSHPITEAAARRPNDEPPPFDPPRGSAYFRWVAEVGLQAADALAHAHHEGVIHRDVKPSNLLIDGKGSIWVTDFGLARRLADPGLTHHDSLLGTPRYMSPEQARTGAIDGRTDVYSLGATLYELLTLRPPFDGRSAAELIEQIGQNEPVPPTSLDVRVPRDLETIVLKALAKRSTDRYATAAELAEDLARFLNHEPVKARRISPIGRLWRVARRHPGITSVSTAAAAAILAIATYAYTRVLAERDKVYHLLGENQQALQQAEDANHRERAAMKEGLLKAIEVVGLSGAPTRRRQGLDLIRETVALGPEAELRPKLRDEAVKSLVLREVLAQEPELPTGRAHGLVFGARGRRLAVLSEDEEELSFWDVERRQRQSTLSLRFGTGTGPTSSEPLSNDGTPGNRNESVQGSPLGPGLNRNTAGSAMSGAGGRRLPSWFVSQRVAQVGQSVATILPDDKGLAIIDLDIAPGAPPRMLNPPDRAVLSVVCDPGGKRMVTIEQVIEDPDAALESMSSADPFGPSDFQVNLWDPDQLDRPKKRLQWQYPSDGPPRRPLIAISPDGKTVAVGGYRGKFLRLFAAADGSPINIRNDGRPQDKNLERNQNLIDTQTELSALTLGANDTLATAGTTVIKIWNLADPRNVPTSLQPLSQNYTRLMRFSPQGTLLAIAGAGPIELWDPMAHNLVAVLKMNDQATDLAFAPDGQTLAAVGRAGGTSVWTVQDSAARTQLSGFDSPPSSLAFSADGVLAGGGWRGDIWFWRHGRCPELVPPTPLSSVTAAPPHNGKADGGRPESRARDGTRKGEHDRPRDGNRSTNRGDRMSSVVGLTYDGHGRLVAHDAQGLRIWPAGSTSVQTPPTFKEPLPPVPGNGPSRTPTMAKTADGRDIVLLRSSTLFLWNADAPENVMPLIPPHGWGGDSGSIANKTVRPAGATGVEAILPQFRAVQIAPGGDRLYLLEQQSQPTGNPLHVWGVEHPSPSVPPRAHDLNWSLTLGDAAISLALRGDGTLLAVGDRTGSVTLIDTSTHRVVGTIQPLNRDSENPWLSMAFSPDGQALAIGSWEGTTSLWSVAQPRQPRLRFHLPGHRGPITSLAFDPLSRRLASAGTDPLVEVWDLELLDRELIRLGLAD